MFDAKLSFCLGVGLVRRANLGRGKALPCTPDSEGAATPRPYLRELGSRGDPLAR
jgi:hypothetical protein